MAANVSDTNTSKPDLVDSHDVQELVNAFYRKVFADDLLAPFFAHMHEDRWASHLKVMYQFWENVIFYSGGYFGNPIASHKKMNERKPIDKIHFDRWLKLFSDTVDEHFEGEKAELAKQRAYSLAVVMQLKMSGQTLMP